MTRESELGRHRQVQDYCDKGLGHFLVEASELSLSLLSHANAALSKRGK
jgi:hypothetical protein